MVLQYVIKTLLLKRYFISNYLIDFLVWLIMMGTLLRTEFNTRLSLNSRQRFLDL